MNAYCESIHQFQRPKGIHYLKTGAPAGCDETKGRTFGARTDVTFAVREADETVEPRPSGRRYLKPIPLAKYSCFRERERARGRTPPLNPGQLGEEPQVTPSVPVAKGPSRSATCECRSLLIFGAYSELGSHGGPKGRRRSSLELRPAPEPPAAPQPSDGAPSGRPGGWGRQGAVRDAP